MKNERVFYPAEADRRDCRSALWCYLNCSAGMREGLAPLLNRQSDMEVVAQASDEGAAIEMFRQD